MNKYPKVTITFPFQNSGSEALECINSINKLDYPKDKIEIIVVDNASTDGSGDQIKKKFPDVILYRQKTNLGFAKGVNLAIKRAKGEYIFIANDDLLFEKNSLKILVNYHLAQPDTGILGGKIFSKDKPKKVISSGYFMNKQTGHVYTNPEYDKQIEPDWVQGCALLIPKKVLDEIGLLDTGYSHFFEDHDLAVRTKMAGYKVAYLPKAKFWHRESTTANRDKSKKYYHWYRNKIRFILKNLSLLNIASILFLQLFFITPYRAIILGDGRFIPFVRGLFWNFKNSSATLSLRN